jgi:hypothetical protein
MEEMSKKTKRLEKENLALNRKHEATNQSIYKMAEDRSRMLKELEQERRKKESLEKLCRVSRIPIELTLETSALLKVHSKTLV